MLKIIKNLIYGKEYRAVKEKFEKMVAYLDWETEARMALGCEYSEPTNFKEFEKEFNDVYGKYEDLRKKMRL